MPKILIVDDHVLNREFLMTLLGYGGHRVLEAADGVAGLEIVRAERPDLIITDILMPNMDGYEFVSRIHAESDPTIAQIPIIFYTASYREREANVMARACNVRWVLQKPSEPELILTTVQEALGLPKAPAGPPPLTPPPREGSRFATVDNQLAECLVELEASSQLISQIAYNGESESSETHLEEMRRLTQRLSKSFSNLQAVSLRLTALIELGIELAGERDPAHLVETGCRVAQHMGVAKYAAIGILDDSGTQLSHFCGRGLSDETDQQLGSATPAAGLLGKLLSSRTPHRMHQDDDDAQQLGLPASHPPVNSFLGVSIATPDRIYGWLYLVDKLGAEEFSEVDEKVAATVATQLGMAYENLVLYDEIQQHDAHLRVEMAERVKAQDALHRTLRARMVMAECNHVMVHADDELVLLSDMCRTVVERGGYRMAWIAYRNDEDAMIPMAQAGDREGPLNPIAADWIEQEHGWCPAAASIQTGSSRIVADAAADPRLEAWRAHVVSRGYRSALSLPMKDGARVFGVLTIYESQPDAFDIDQVAMFEELVDDIAYGVVNLRTKAARGRAEQSLQASQDKLTGILASIDNVVWSATAETFLYVSPIAEKVFDRPLQDFYQHANFWLQFVHPDDRDKVREWFANLLQGGALVCEYRILRPDGEIRWLEDRATLVRDVEGAPSRLDGVAADITIRKTHEARIEYLANHDALTDLANRYLLSDRMTQAMLNARRDGHRVALLFLDLDRFKNINDSFGHVLGDALLQEVALRLRDTVRECDTVARQGGDEFIILLTNLLEPQDVSRIAAKIIQSFTAPFEIAGHQLHVTASIGASVYPNDGDEIHHLLRNADTAMYRAKEESGSTFEFYSRDMSIRAMERTELEEALRNAIEHQEFELFYQPKVNLASGRIVGAEALIRWHRPGLGLVMPGHFIPLAEETGLIVPIGTWVMQAACAQNKAWQKAGLAPVRLAINLSARQFRLPELVPTVAAALRSSGLQPQYLELELTESMVMNSAEQFVAKLKNLKAIGVSLSIDDFGTGYSSLSYLKRFPIDALKIDQSFVRDIVTDAEDAAITRSIISLGHSLNLKVIAEGVNSEAQLAYLQRHRCDEIQGHFFSEAVPAQEFARMLQHGKTLSRGIRYEAVPRQTLLILDDESAVVAALKYLLRHEDYQILSALRPAEAFELLALHQVQVVISDQRMPLMDGTEFLGKVKDMYPDTIRIILSGYTGLASVIDSINRGAVYRFITKPWEDEVLLNNIREAFQHHWLLHGAAEAE